MNNHREHSEEEERMILCLSPGDGMIQCIGPVDGVVPDEIQFLPPGKRTVVAHQIDRAGGETPKTVTVDVDEATAQRLGDELRSQLASGREPYLDFDHNRKGPASAWVKDVWWGGTDPKLGGVRARVEWTARGRAAVLGKDYRFFSPAFVPGDRGEIVGSGIRMGGLCNFPAFSDLKIAAAGADAQQQENQMDGDNSAQALAAKDAENAELKRQLAALQASQAEQQKVNAKALVQAACSAGKLPAKATAYHEKWVLALCARPEDAELLEGLPVREVPGRMIQASAVDRTEGVSPDAGEDQGAKQRAAVAEYQASHPGIGFDRAWSGVRAARPELFVVAAE